MKNFWEKNQVKNSKGSDQILLRSKRAVDDQSENKGNQSPKVQRLDNRLETAKERKSEPKTRSREITPEHNLEEQRDGKPRRTGLTSNEIF